MHHLTNLQFGPKVSTGSAASKLVATQLKAQRKRVTALRKSFEWISLCYSIIKAESNAFVDEQCIYMRTVYIHAYSCSLKVQNGNELSGVFTKILLQTRLRIDEVFLIT